MTRLLTLTCLTLLLWAPPSVGATPQPKHRRYALLVGANDGGQERVRLRYAGTDAQSVARVLTDLGGVDRDDQRVLLGPGRTQVLAALGDLRKQLERAPKGTRTEVFFYYSGHADERGLLLREDRLGFRELREAIDALPADLRISILDACASGAFARSKGGARAPAFLVDTSSTVSGHAILTSSSEDEVSQESDRIAGSYFTHHLVSGLRGAADLSGDGRITLNEAYQFAFAHTLKRTEQTQAGPQHASYDIQLKGRGELVMTDLRSNAAGLTLASALDGHLFVRDAQGGLVVELDKAAGEPTQLGLAPGAYRITRAKGTERSTADVVLAPGQPTSLSASAFRAMPLEPVVTRGGGRSAEPSDLRKRLINLSLWSGISTNDLILEPVENRLSVGLISTRSAGLDGVALSLGSNRVDGHQRGLAAALVSNIAGEVHGFQASLGGNWAMRQLSGAQLSLGVNVAAADASWLQATVASNLAMQDFKGAQLSAGGSYVGGRLRGAQASAGFSWAQQGVGGLQAAAGYSGTAGDLVGAQLAGGLSTVGGHLHGLQAAGGVAIAQQLSGLQLSVLNLGGQVHGAQIGVVNIAESVDGLQLGVVNVASESPLSLGLLSFVKNGRFAVEAYGSDLAAAHVSLKTGSRHVYAVVSVGSQLPGAPEAAWFTGAGIGLHLPLGSRLSVDVDAHALSFRRYERSWNTDSIVPQLRGQLAWKFAEHFSVFAGPTLSVRVPLDADAPDASLGLVAPILRVGGLPIWPGFVAGVQL